MGGSQSSPRTTKDYLKTNAENFLQTLLVYKLICPSTVWAQVSTEVEHQASEQRPNLLAAIDIPFPLALLSYFAFRGFPLSPQCPACGL